MSFGNETFVYDGMCNPASSIKKEALNSIKNTIVYLINPHALRGVIHAPKGDLHANYYKKPNIRSHIQTTTDLARKHRYYLAIRDTSSERKEFTAVAVRRRAAR